MYLGIDIGSVSVKYALIDKKNQVLKSQWKRSHGQIIESIQNILKENQDLEIKGLAITGSARKFIEALLSADYSIDEITAHRTAVNYFYPEVKTIFEIGGQDSKLILIDGLSIDFEMNSVCAAGTGSFLDQQAARLGYDIENFYQTGLKTQESHKIAGKCTVFAETDMIHAQQSGVPREKIIRGVHRSLVHNYFATLARGKKLKSQFLFEGGAADNRLLVDEFANRLIEEKLIKNEEDLIVPEFNKVMGAIGAAILAKNNQINNPRKLPQIKDFKFLKSEECYQCRNRCGANISKVKINGQVLTLGKICQG
jgi:predicted CoA-substrate-specific enzyme activase